MKNDEVLKNYVETTFGRSKHWLTEIDLTILAHIYEVQLSIHTDSYKTILTPEYKQESHMYFDQQHNHYQIMIKKEQCI